MGLILTYWFGGDVDEGLECVSLENLKENLKDGLPAGLIGGVGGSIGVIIGMAVSRGGGFGGTEALVVTVAGGAVALAGWLVVVWKANLVKRLEEKIDGEG